MKSRCHISRMAVWCLKSIARLQKSLNRHWSLRCGAPTQICQLWGAASAGPCRLPLSQSRALEKPSVKFPRGTAVGAYEVPGRICVTTRFYVHSTAQQSLTGTVVKSMSSGNCAFLDIITVADLSPS